MNKPTATEPTQRLTDATRIGVTMAGGVMLWFIAYIIFAATAGLDQQMKVIGIVTGNYGLVVLEALFGWILLLAVVPRTFKFLIPVSLVVALPTLLTVMYGLGLGIIYVYENRTAAVILCCLLWLALGWQIWSWGNTKKKGKKKPRQA